MRSSYAGVANLRSGWIRQPSSVGQPRYSDLPIELVLNLRLVFHLALRQVEGFARSMLALLGLELHVPDHTTLSRRGRAFAKRQPRVPTGGGPVHLVLDSMGLELFSQGEWYAAKHGRARRRWLKLHIGMDATTGEIAAHVLTAGHRQEAPHLVGIPTPPRTQPQLGGVEIEAQVPWLNSLVYHP